MQADKNKLAERAFGAPAKDTDTVQYQSFNEAVSFLQSVLREPDAVGLLYGPPLAGKTTLMRHLASSLDGDVAVAAIDVSRKKPLELLTEIILQFGYDTGLHSTDELLKMISVFALQQTRAHEPPVLILDNIDMAFPSARKMLSTLAELTGQEEIALRMLFTSRGSHVTDIPDRQVRIHALEPLSPKECAHYLYSRLQSAGAPQPDALMPLAVCERLHAESGGWPGELNHRAREHLSPTLPRLVMSRDGEPLLDYAFKDKKVLIGRSEFADIIVPDAFASKLHAMLLLYSDALVLLDLNSANGTTVNSKPVKSTILRDGDIITLGHHRIKVMDPPLVTPEIEAILSKQDTVKMRNLVEARRLRAASQPAIVRRRSPSPAGTQFR